MGDADDREKNERERGAIPEMRGIERTKDVPKEWLDIRGELGVCDGQIKLNLMCLRILNPGDGKSVIFRNFDSCLSRTFHTK